MPIIRQVINPNTEEATPPKAAKDACALRVGAKLVSLNGGIVLALCILFTAITVASVMTRSFVASQSILFFLLMVACWIYLIDGVSERISLVGDTIIRSSVIGRNVSIKLRDIKSLLLRHEGLNQQIGIESITVEYRDGRTERMPLGPCWRRRELEAFLSSVEQVMGYQGVVEHER